MRSSDNDILIQVNPFRGRLTPRAPITGYATGDQVLEHSPQHGLIKRAYRPDKKALARLKQAAGALRVEQELPESGVAFTYYGLASPPAAWKDARFLQSQAKALPTALVFVNDKLAGRIAPNGWKRFDAELAALIRQE